MNTEIDNDKTNEILMSAEPVAYIDYDRALAFLRKLFLSSLISEWPKILPAFTQVNDKWFAITFILPDTKEVARFVGKVDAICVQAGWHKSIYFREYGESSSESVGQHMFYTFWIPSKVIVSSMATGMK